MHRQKRANIAGNARSSVFFRQEAPGGELKLQRKEPEMNSSFTLSILLVFVVGIIRLEASKSSDTNPTAKFFERIQYIPILLYQCYSNGTVYETAQSYLTSSLFDGTSGTEDYDLATSWEVQKGRPKSSKTVTYRAAYIPKVKMGIIMVNDTYFVTMKILQTPYKGLAYFVKYGVYDDATTSGYKIYDRVETCTNADDLLPKVCPDGCGMVSVKANIPLQVF
ncbi:uncharacterized protein ISCGN_004593 [Ixodes scapularis]